MLDWIISVLITALLSPGMEMTSRAPAAPISSFVDVYPSDTEPDGIVRLARAIVDQIPDCVGFGLNNLPDQLQWVTERVLEWQFEE
jgi:hypothetical protein